MATPRVLAEPAADAAADISHVGVSRSIAAAGGLALLAVAVLANLLLQGFDFPRYNNVFHIAIALDYAGSIEGPHDVFHQTLDAYVSALWPLLRSLVTEDNIFAVFFTVYALNRAALVLFVYLAAAEISGRGSARSLAAVTGAAVLLLWPAWSLSPLAYNDIFVRALSQTELAVTGLVASFWLLLRRNWMWSAVVLGVAFNFSAFLAIWGTVIAAGAYLWTNRAVPVLMLARRLLALILVTGAFAAPTAVWIAATVAGAQPAVPFDYSTYLEEFFPFHNLVHPNWTGAAITVALAIAVWHYVQDRDLYRSPDHREIAVAAFAILVAIVLAGAIQPYLFDSWLIGCLFPLRMDSYLLLPLGIVLIATALDDAAQRGHASRFWADGLVLLALAGGNMPLALYAVTMRSDGRRTGAPAAAGLLLCAVHVGATGSMPVLFAGTGGLALGFATAQAIVASVAVRERPGTAAALLVMAGLIVPALIGSELSAPAEFAVSAAYAAAAAACLGGNAIASGVVAAVAAVAAVAFAAEASGTARAAVPVGSALAVLYLARRDFVLSAIEMVPRVGATTLIAVCLVAGVARAAISGGVNYLPAEERAIVDAAKWLRAYSQPDELVLPLDIMEFSTFSRRPVWVDRKMGAAVMWAPYYYPIWRDRMAAVARLTTLDAAATYARRNDIRYIVVRRADQGRLGASDGAADIYANSHIAVLATAPDRQ